MICEKVLELLEKLDGDRGSLVVKVTDSRPACHEFDPVPVKSQTSSRCCGVVVRRGGASSAVIFALDHTSKLRDASPKALV
ncbi:hypothetical protein TNCV_3721231 [Trichonephila clavipes]|nr:hypothetical protein TNCV_3721231 [Trichonephila clavipes]